jgi:hypothetical protein
LRRNRGRTGFCRIVRRHPHDAGEVAGARGQQHDVGHRAIDRRVLLVDHDEIIAERAEYLRRVRGGRLDERADDGLPRGEAAAE